ncbi:MAG: hypothetical protein U0638_13435 [Phycisphaerales bacterium]
MRAWTMAAACFVGVGATCLGAARAAGDAVTIGAGPDWPKEAYLAVPLKGEIGNEVTAPGVRDAIKFAADNKIADVMLYFETPGGVVADGLAIAKVIHERPDGVKIHAVVEEAYSAAMWPLVECDAVWVVPSGRMGAAVAFRINPETGSAEVDRKLIAALATRLGAVAEAHGMASALFKAMVDMEAEVWVLRAEGAPPRITSEPPDDAEGKASAFDDRNSVVALDATQSVDFAVAKRTPGEVRSWNDLALDKSAPGKDGSRFMKAAATKISRERKAAERAKEALRESLRVMVDQSDFIKSEVKRAVKNDPTTIKLYRKEGSGFLTAASAQKWRDRTDECLGIWNSIVTACNDLHRAVQAYRERRGAYADARGKIGKVALWESESDPLDADESVEEILDGYRKFADNTRKTADEELARLKKGRSRLRVDE